jgi:hypothetical protein
VDIHLLPEGDFGERDSIVIELYTPVSIDNSFFSKVEDLSELKPLCICSIYSFYTWNTQLTVHFSSVNNTGAADIDREEEKRQNP